MEQGNNFDEIKSKLPSQGPGTADRNTLIQVSISLAKEKKELEEQALEWSATRGARSGRVAWQFIQDLAGQLGKTLKL